MQHRMLASFPKSVLRRKTRPSRQGRDRERHWQAEEVSEVGYVVNFVL